MLRVLRNALNRAMREELLTRNVALLVDMPKVNKDKGTAWSAREAITFLRSTRAHRLYAACVLVLVLAEHGGMIDPTGFSRCFDRLVKRAGVRRITVRLARHTCGTLLAFPPLVALVRVNHGCQKTPGPMVRGSSGWWG
ncbi:hypothetical protein [Streptomyces sp. NPDC096132]|uniref:hypothetical protein n=1 Tax=Streptomyces sp. NPDC096132 TaxID=3366075 RepID=UPI003816E172